MRLYVVGDIHGRADLLQSVQAQVEADAARHPDRERWLIFLGDYVDRGPQSREVLEHLSGPPAAGLNRCCLMGNHEQALLSFLADPVAGAHWLEFGALATLSSYQVAPPPADVDGLLAAAAALRAALPAHQRAFLEQLELSRRFGDYLFVHAGIRPGLPLTAQTPQDLLWIREPFLSARRPHPLMVVHGHHITEAIDVRANRIGVDTGAYATGRLSCLVLEGTGRWLLDTRAGGPRPLPD
jgi:serine/threonine protein phosphatase 1